MSARLGILMLSLVRCIVISKVNDANAVIVSSSIERDKNRERDREREFKGC